MINTSFVYDPFNLRHTKNGHPENFRRLETTWALLENDGILEQLHRVQSTPASLESLLRVHTPAHVEQVKRMAAQGRGQLDSDTYVNTDSYQAALLAAGGLLNVVDSVMTGETRNGFALVRPPGHHALSERGMGFCLFANVSVAARWAQDHYSIERILIIDFDVHHGNGTQDIFYDDPSILFFSIHQFPHYPGTGAGNEIGSDDGRGTTINIPAPPGTGDAGYLASFQQILAPAARRFQPELILLSAGYDGHWRDPLASILLSVTGYTALVQEVMALAIELCDGRLVCALEGGYDVDVLAHCVLSTLRVLSGSDRGISDPYGLTPYEEHDIQPLLEQVKALHKV